MKTNSDNFNALVAIAMRDANYSSMQPVIEKELLHYDILYCLKEHGFLNHLTFQGGTSLRLCYGSNRLSEDLDFAGGFDFKSTMIADMKQCLEDYLGLRYALEVSVRNPASLRGDSLNGSIKVDKWQIAVTTSPERRDLPKQKIKIEVANIPAYTHDVVLLNANYDFLPDGYDSILVPTESKDEILADKLLSLPATAASHVRFRDIWDISWLKQRGATSNMELLTNKINDYNVYDYQERVTLLMDKLPSIIQSDTFKSEMIRFLPLHVYQRTLGESAFAQHLEHSLLGVFQRVLVALDTPPNSPSFEM